jgi:hypothetical protein
MRVRMAVHITGTRDGHYWPEAGETVELPAWEANRLIANGSAEKVEAWKPAKKSASKK